MSAFSRIYGVDKANKNDSYKAFCRDWSTWNLTAPLESLDLVDRYFMLEYERWKSN